MDAEELRADLNDKLLRGEYRGLQIEQFRWLLRKLPYQHRRDRAEILQEIEFWTQEAISLYDPARKAKFSTWLVQHLRLRAASYQQRLWVRSSAYKSCRMLRLDEQRHRLPDLSASLLAVQELVASLSESAREVWNAILQRSSIDELCDMFRSAHFRHKVSEATGIDKRSVEQFVAEIKEKLPAYL